MAETPTIVAHRVTGAVKAPTPEQLQRLAVSDASQIRYRRVELRCGAHTLSDADNWYVPARLTAAMNASLDTSDTPFGRVVEALRPYRRTFAVTLLWAPLPAGWEQDVAVRSQPRQAGTLAIPKALFEHRALLYTSEGTPFSEVTETYQGSVLSFPRGR
jgi:hypothetical protein